MTLDQPTPATIGRYRIDGVLGEGAMAIVYAGFDPQIQRHVAIKCMHAQVAADPAYRRRFQVEARAAGHLNHPHIVTIFDSGETEDGRPYIAMERLSGETLASKVAAEGFPSVTALIGLAAQLASALDYAHEHGVIHHDIKPDNIMLVDGWQHAKMADFGIAERRTAARSKPIDAPTKIGGTPSYMSPERLRGERADARSDLFSLGVVLFWLVTGRLPWSYSGDLQRLVRQRQRLPEPPIKPRDVETPSILIDIVRTLMAPLPDARYQRGAEVVDDLQLVRRSYERSREAHATAPIQSLGMRWAAVLGATVVAVLLLGMLAIYTKQSIAVTGLARDFGASLGRMIAGEAAENIVMGDHAATRALVQDISRNQQIDYLAIADRQGEIIASTKGDEAGHAFPVVNGQDRSAGSNGIVSYRMHPSSGRDGPEMLVFDVPIHYQDKTIGALRLGVSDAPLRTAQNTALWVLGLVLCATLVAVLLAAYWLFGRLREALELLAAAHLRVFHGDYRHRIRLVRRDEIGRLYATFNLMNESLGGQGGEPEVKPAPDPQQPLLQPTELITPPRPDAQTR
jgi:eukaryotic-like serine/threonine-protein kinase